MMTVVAMPRERENMKNVVLQVHNFSNLSENTTC